MRDPVSDPCKVPESHWNTLAPVEKVLLAVFLFLAFLLLALAVFSLGRDAFEDAHSPASYSHRGEQVAPDLADSFSVGQSPLRAQEPSRS